MVFFDLIKIWPFQMMISRARSSDNRWRLHISYIFPHLESVSNRLSSFESTLYVLLDDVIDFGMWKSWSLNVLVVYRWVATGHGICFGNYSYIWVWRYIQMYMVWFWWFWMLLKTYFAMQKSYICINGFGLPKIEKAYRCLSFQKSYVGYILDIHGEKYTDLTPSRIEKRYKGYIFDIFRNWEKVL